MVIEARFSCSHSHVNVVSSPLSTFHAKYPPTAVATAPQRPATPGRALLERPSLQFPKTRVRATRTNIFSFFALFPRSGTFLGFFRWHHPSVSKHDQLPLFLVRKHCLHHRICIDEAKTVMFREILDRRMVDTCNGGPRAHQRSRVAQPGQNFSALSYVQPTSVLCRGTLPRPASDSAPACQYQSIGRSHSSRAALQRN
jgi:hypothetical protein